MDDIRQRRNNSYHVDQRLVRSSLLELNQRIGTYQVELAHYRALSARGSDYDRCKSASACRSTKTALVADQVRFDEIVASLPERLRGHTRLADTQRALDALNSLIETVLSGLVRWPR
jgi:hypothetical protein